MPWKAGQECPAYRALGRAMSRLYALTFIGRMGIFTKKAYR